MLAYQAVLLFTGHYSCCLTTTETYKNKKGITLRLSLVVYRYNGAANLLLTHYLLSITIVYHLILL